MHPNLATVSRTAETLAIATAGALTFTAVGIPVALVIGSMVCVGVAALLGRPMMIPTPLARPTFVLLGISLGAVVTPATLSGIVHWPLSIAIMCVSTFIMTAATAGYLRVVHGWDPMSALFGGSPGALAQVMSLSIEQKSDLRAIVVVQSVRVVFLTIGIPAGLAYFGMHGKPAASLGGPGFNAPFWDYVLLFVVSIATVYLLKKVRFPGAYVFGGMLGSGILHGTGYMEAILPWWWTSAFVIVLGATTGARFANTDPKLLLTYFGAALGSFLVAITVAGTFLALVWYLMAPSVPSLVVAFSPGAQDTMMVMALALHIDPIFVGAHQLMRFLVVSLSLPIQMRRILRAREKAGLPPPLQDE
jgi:membrane AbrB-like protein